MLAHSVVATLTMAFLTSESSDGLVWHGISLSEGVGAEWGREEGAAGVERRYAGEMSVVFCSSSYVVPAIITIHSVLSFIWMCASMEN